MDKEKVIAELVELLKECQRMFGHDDADSVTRKTCPHGGLKGFQSDVTPTVVRRLAKKLGQPLAEDVDPVNIFVSADKMQKLTVEEAAERFVQRYGTGGTK